MLRTVPDTGTEEIELYIRTYYSLMRTTDAIKIQTLVESYMAINSSLHIYAREATIDTSALVYCSLRLPLEIIQADLVVLGQFESDFERAGYGEVEAWERVHAAGRRRRSHFNGSNILAVMIASRSDIDDIVPILTAFQIEWNKIHDVFRTNRQAKDLLKVCLDSDVPTEETLSQLADVLTITDDDFSRLQSAWKSDFWPYLNAIANRRLNLSLQLLAGSQVKYRKAVGVWWNNLNSDYESDGGSLQSAAVYFVSSNTHSIANLVSGYAASIQNQLLSFIQQTGNIDLLNEWDTLQPDDIQVHNYFYYLLKKYQSHFPTSIQEMVSAEESVGMFRIPAIHGFDIEAQVIRLQNLDPAKLDPRLM